MSKIDLQQFRLWDEDRQKELIEFYRRVFLDDNNTLDESDRITNVSNNLGAYIRTLLPRKSSAAVRARALQTYKQRTGFDHPMNNPDVVDKLKQTNIDRYGGVGFQSSELAARTRATCKEKYGVENYAQSLEFSDKLTESSIRKYGVTNPAKSDKVKAKIKATQYERFGDLFCRTEEFVHKRRETSMQRYGVDNPMRSPEVRAKIEKQNVEKWGVPYWMMLPESQRKLHEGCKEKFGTEWYSSSHLSKECLDIIHNPDKLIDFVTQLPEEQRTHTRVSELLGCSCVYLLELTRGYGDDVRSAFTMFPAVSDKECSVRDLIESWNIAIIPNDRNTLAPQELDIYVPSKGFAVEFNGWYWHSKQAGTPVSYHQSKSLACADRGIQLYHIFEQDWDNANKRAIIESQLRCKLLSESTRIFARNCDVRLVSIADARSFLNRNHLQGYRNSAIRIGLYYNNELVDIMTFGKAYLHRDSGCWEIYRLCSKLNTTVVGGASRLFKHFLHSVRPSKVVTYSDISTGTGNVYTALGFTFVRITSPNYKWVGEKDQKSRYQCQFKDEVKIMESRGYVQLYDSGNILWEYVDK